MSRRCTYASLVLILICSAFLIPATTHGTPANHLLISEILYDPAAPEPGGEWVELFNPTADPVDLTGWALRDNASADVMPAATLGPGQFLIVASSQGDFMAANPGFSGALVSLEGSIGNGLGNSGDVVSLLDGGGGIVDAASYGSDASAFDPPCPDASEGQSLSRQPPEVDSDGAVDWMAGAPTPGGPATPPPPTATDTPLPTVAPTPTPTTTLTPTREPTATPTPTPSASPTPTPTGTRRPHADVHSQRIANVDRYRNANGNPDSDAHPQRITNANDNRHTAADPHANAHSERIANVDRYRNANGNPHANAQPQRITNDNQHTAADPHADAHPQRITDAIGNHYRLANADCHRHACDLG